MTRSSSIADDLFNLDEPFNFVPDIPGPAYRVYELDGLRRIMTAEIKWCADCQRYDPACNDCHGSGYRLSSTINNYGPCEWCDGDLVTHSPEFYG